MLNLLPKKKKNKKFKFKRRELQKIAKKMRESA